MGRFKILGGIYLAGWIGLNIMCALFYNKMSGKLMEEALTVSASLTSKR